jgi:hypothetical protein
VALSNVNSSMNPITKTALQGYQLWHTPTVRRDFGKSDPDPSAQRFPPRTGTDDDWIEDEDDLLLSKIPIPTPAAELEAALTGQRLTREKKPLPVLAIAKRRVLSVAVMEEAFKEIWDVGHKGNVATNLFQLMQFHSPDLKPDQKDGFRHDLYIVFEASYHMYDAETGWNLGNPSPTFITNNVEFYKRFIADPKAKAYYLCLHSQTKSMCMVTLLQQELLQAKSYPHSTSQDQSAE